MTDRTQLQLVLRDVPHAQVGPLAQLLADHDLTVDWDGPPAQPGTVELGTPYTARGVAADAAVQLADDIIHVAPRATFLVWTDPAHEWLGRLVRHTPQLGTHRADCDADGHAQFTEAEILRAEAAGGRAGLRAATGAAWTAALAGTVYQQTLSTDQPTPH